MAIASYGTREGTVSTFDHDRGLGTVTDASGATLLFHCTAIADGSRTIDPGTPVVFDVVAGHGGTLEAASVRPI